METKIYLSNEVGGKWKKYAMERFGYGRGSISKAAEEALIFWVEREEKIKDMLDKFVKIAESDTQILAIFIFGSYARREIYRDVDIALVLNDSDSNASLIGKIGEFDRVVPSGLEVDISIFNTLNLSIKSRILSEGILLYARNMDLVYDLSTEVIKEYADLKPIIDIGLGL